MIQVSLNKYKLINCEEFEESPKEEGERTFDSD
jgi:hypothetical protein